MAVTIARTAWTDDDGSGTTGAIINNAVKTGLYDQIDGALGQVGAQIDFDMGGDLSIFVSDTGYVDIPNRVQRSIIGVTGVTYFLEVEFIAETASAVTAYAQLYNVTGAAVVGSSPMSQALSSTTSVRAVSGGFSLSGTATYKVQIYGTTGAGNKVAAKVTLVGR